MSKRSLLAALCFVGILIVAGTAGNGYLRKELPYEFDIVPVEGGIGITNTTTWNERDLLVSWRREGPDAETSMVMNHSLNQCVVGGLEDNQTYTIRIRRMDLPGRFIYKAFQTEIVTQEPAPTYVLLVGASVGKAWDLPSLPKRLKADGLVFGYRGKYGYDKTDVIDRIVKSQIRPDIVIIKECAAYFPKERGKIIERLPGWVEMLKAEGITPVVATCCPVTKENDRANPGKQAAIDEFNSFVRTLGVENHVEILDLAGTLSISETNSYLRESFAQPDGLHLNQSAYSALDHVLMDISVAWPRRQEARE
ncbi:MAG: SGNH/GDSL hydrolase family protein [Candidatus Abyssobacteria bacterium SURF_17]|uniref:SGNH/GDSL hydrolase family protein n=1 Tax=Candidatus Abyssobacteria bacterium SURF_17 TaxID=2093361 RepID=A0A419F293_9BACT|nr:MAG: SGNH/GDSL hydrolase family protein [Candidatus Abyssubacteria bacterium SURF_17]